MLDYYFEYAHCWFHACIHAIEAHLASFGDDRLHQAKHENLRREWERRLHRLEVNRRFI